MKKDTVRYGLLGVAVATTVATLGWQVAKRSFTQKDAERLALRHFPNTSVEKCQFVERDAPPLWCVWRVSGPTAKRRAVFPNADTHELIKGVTRWTREPEIRMPARFQASPYR